MVLKMNQLVRTAHQRINHQMDAQYYNMFPNKRNIYEYNSNEIFSHRYTPQNHSHNSNSATHLGVVLSQGIPCSSGMLPMLRNTQTQSFLWLIIKSSPGPSPSCALLLMNRMGETRFQDNCSDTGRMEIDVLTTHSLSHIKINCYRKIRKAFTA